MRLSWEKYAMRLAQTASERSEDPYVKVGACALDFDNRVLGVSYNGLAPDKDVDAKFWEDRDYRRKYMIHAETNCLSLFKGGQCKILACTLLPCSSCATQIAAYRIPIVVYKDVYQRDKEAEEIFKFYNIKLIKFEGEEFEDWVLKL